MAEVALDANVIVGVLDRTDAVHVRATALCRRLIDRGDTLIYLDVCVSEAVSVIARRAHQRRSNQPDLASALSVVREWVTRGAILFVGAEVEARYALILDIVASSSGALNVNDAALVVLQRDSVIGAVATFDNSLTAFDQFATIT